MRKEEKAAIIDSLAEQLQKSSHFYIADISGLNAEKTSKLRRICFEKEVKLVVVKNTLLQKALEKNNFPETELYTVLNGPTSVFFTETANAPAKLIKEFGDKYGKPELKGAFVQEGLYLGAGALMELVNIKSRDEIIGDIIGLLQSPLRNILSGLEAAAKELGEEQTIKEYKK